jgi:hypothetical protein
VAVGIGNMAMVRAMLDVNGVKVVSQDTNGRLTSSPNLLIPPRNQRSPACLLLPDRFLLPSACRSPGSLDRTRAFRWRRLFSDSGRFSGDWPLSGDCRFSADERGPGSCAVSFGWFADLSMPHTSKISARLQDNSLSFRSIATPAISLHSNAYHSAPQQRPYASGGGTFFC